MFKNCFILLVPCKSFKEFLATISKGSMRVHVTAPEKLKPFFKQICSGLRSIDFITGVLRE